MVRSKVLIATRWFEDKTERLRREFKDKCDVLSITEMKEEEVSEIEIVIGPSIQEEFIRKATNLKLIIIPWTGIDLLPLVFLKNYPDIVITNSHANSMIVAEHAISLALAVSKRIVYHHNRLIQGHWKSEDPELENSLSLIGKKVAIFGFGAIGQSILQLLQGFKVEILVIKQNPSQISNAWKNQVREFLPSNILTISKVLEQVDFTFLALPLTDQTRHIINAETLSRVNPKGILINVSRGEIIDEKALYDALKEKRLGGTGFDPQFEYPRGKRVTLPYHYPFDQIPTVVVSPHRAWKTIDVSEKYYQDTVDNLDRFLEGKSLRNVVDTKRGY